MSVRSLDQLPLEILLGILRYFDIPDILGLRRVSRYLCEVSHRRDVWTHVYRHADSLPRPPGPFLSLSARDLEGVLVSSFRVHRNLGRSLGDGTLRKLREIRYRVRGVELEVRLVFARFLFIALREEVRCYDLNLDNDSGASIVYRPMDGKTISSFQCVSAIDVEGRPFACVVLKEVALAGIRTQISIYLLNVGVQSEITLDLLHQFEYGQFNNFIIRLGPRVIVVSGCVGGDDWRVVALDVHARTQLPLNLPSFKFSGLEMGEASGRSSVTPLMSISTSTHLILGRTLLTRTTGWCTSFQAYILPPPNAQGCLTPLSRSHHGIISAIDVRFAVLLHDAILDPSTQDVLIAIRVHALESSQSQVSVSKYGILRLGKSNDEVGTIELQLLGSLGRPFQTASFQPSFNGTGRVFHMHKPGPYNILTALEYDIRSNGGGDNELKVVEYPSVKRFMTLCWLLDYDPYSGRICLQSSIGGEAVIEILDLAM